MNRRPAVARLVLLAMFAALATSLLATVPVAAVDADSAGPTIEFVGDPGREAVVSRPFRRVDLRSLPPARGKASPHEPAGSRPASARTPAAPEPQGGAVPPPPVEASSNGDPEIDQATAFAGLARNTTGATMGEPPDPWVAAGPDHVFQAVNTFFRITDRRGAVKLDIDMFDFFGLGTFYHPSEVAYFDPRVIYDRLHGRWIAIQASFDCDPRPDNEFVEFGAGFVDIAISDGPDPTLGWSIRSIGFADALPDYPAIGTSTDKVVVSSNVYALVGGGPMGCTDGNFLGTEMDGMAWSELIGTGSLHIAPLRTIGGAYFSWRPAVQTPATSATVFAIAEGGDESVFFTRLIGDPSANTASWDTPEPLTATIAPFAQPPQPLQPTGVEIGPRTVDGRPTDAVWKDNKLALVSTYPCDPAGGAVGEERDCVRVSELSTATPADPTLIQDFLVAESGADLFYGGIGYALNDDLHIVWTRSSEVAGAYPSSYGAYQDADAANNSISDRALLSPGTGNYPGGRWGDYLGVAQDPQVPNAVWAGNEYSIGGAGWWGTEITQLQTGGSTFVPIDPVRVLDTRPGAPIGLSGPFSHGVARSWDVAGFGGGTIPDEAIAVTGNLTVTNQTAAGFVSVTPTPNNNPTSSTLNFPLGDTRANNLTVPLNTNGKVAAVYRATAGKSAHLIFDVTGYFVPGDGEAEYNTLAPVRALDSRSGTGLGGAFVKNVPRELSIGPAHVPPEAVAITGNLTVVNQTAAGFLSITPDEVAAPTTSNLNFPLGDARANGFVARLDDEDDVWIVYKSGAAGTQSAHVLLDVTGYFVDDPAGLQYFPLTPGRVMDSRGAPLSRLTGLFTTASPRKLVAGGHWGVPDSAGAITANLTVVGQTAAGFVSVTLTSQPSPTTSNLNFPLGDVRANGITVPVADGRDLWLVYKAATAGKRTHLILDVTGYFE